MDSIPEFEYDADKSGANRDKHGIDFEEAKALWADEGALGGEATHPSELRQMLIGRLAERHWTAVFTMRNGRIRIISVRRSRAREVQEYERQEDN